MDKLKDIAQPIEDFRRAFEELFASSVRSSTPLVQEAIEHIQSTSGKHIRPLLLGLCASLCGGQTNEKSLHSAVILELLHTSSLIHDDVLDQSLQRRGKATLNAIYDNHIAVLVGDYIFSTAFMMATETEDKNLMQIAASVGKELSEGELQQIETAQQKSFTTEEEYYKIIHKKTAVLFEAFAFLGADSIEHCSLKKKMQCATIGKLLGYAFQIKDDIFDYTPTAQVGKPVGNDILEGKITLPLIEVYNNSSVEKRKKIEQWVEEAVNDEKSLQMLMETVAEGKGQELAHQKLLRYTEEAKREILLFADSPARRSLLLLLDFIVVRNF